jgi:hypothetical protein
VNARCTEIPSQVGNHRALFIAPLERLVIRSALPLARGAVSEPSARVMAQIPGQLADY